MNIIRIGQAAFYVTDLAAVAAFLCRLAGSECFA